jgi:xylulokinase
MSDSHEDDTMFLGLDLGTTNVKAVVVDADGQVVADGSAPVERFYTHDGGVEQDIEQIWQAAERAIRSSLENVDAKRILAVGVSSQGGAMQSLDRNDNPLGRVISWLDCRGRPFDAAMTAQLGPAWFARRVGHTSSSGVLGQILRLQRESPERLKSPNRIAFVGDIVVGRLCGSRAHDPTSLGIAMLYNPWLMRSDPDLLARLDLDDNQLPRLLAATEPAGTLRKSVAQTLGLTEGIPVSPAVHDQYAASLGAASVAVGDVNFGAGTAWVLLANADKLTPPATPEAYTCSHPVEGLFGQMLSMVNGGSAIQWAMALLGDRCAAAGTIDDALDAVPPGAEGLRFWPFLSGLPGSDGFAKMKGRLSGIALAHGPNHLIRAVVEGLACELLRHINLLKNAGIPVHRLAMCGSAAGGRNTPQIIADVTQLPVSCIETSGVSAMGAAMLARSLVDAGVKLDEIARQWTPSRRTIAPGECAADYDPLRKEYFSIFKEL